MFVIVFSVVVNVDWQIGDSWSTFRWWGEGPKQFNHHANGYLKWPECTLPSQWYFFIAMYAVLDSCQWLFVWSNELRNCAALTCRQVLLCLQTTIDSCCIMQHFAWSTYHSYGALKPQRAAAMGAYPTCHQTMVGFPSLGPKRHDTCPSFRTRTIHVYMYNVCIYI